MKVKDIQTTNDFINFLSRQKDDENFLALNSKERNDAVCGTAFHSEVLYILPATHDLRNVKNYPNLKFVTINNFKIDKKAFAILKECRKNFSEVKFLTIWNIKQNDLEILELFPNVTHLLISHIGRQDFSYSGLDHLRNLDTLVLNSANRIVDFNFLSRPQKERIRHLYLAYTARLTTLDGIGDFRNLESLSLFASTPESRKTVTLESLDGIEKLSTLRSFEIDFFSFDREVLKEKLSHLKELKQYKVKHEIYDNV